MPPSALETMIHNTTKSINLSWMCWNVINRIRSFRPSFTKILTVRLKLSMDSVLQSGLAVHAVNTFLEFFDGIPQLLAGPAFDHTLVS